MKTRIIKHTKFGKVWYTVEYKNRLFWHTWEGAYGCDALWYNIDDVRSFVRNLEAKEIKEIVK